MDYEKLTHKIELVMNDVRKGIILPTRLTPELAYLCGTLVGDGSIYQRKNKNDYIIKCVGNPKDEQEFYYQVIQPVFKRIFGFKPIVRYHDSGTTFGYAVYSKPIFRFLTEVIGLIQGRKNQDLEVPLLFKEDKSLMKSFIRGLFDTDGCVSFKRRYRDKPYYPVITISSQSRNLIRGVSEGLKSLGFSTVEIYDYKVTDRRTELGFTIINRVELNGNANLSRWLSEINPSSPKHLKKIEKYWEGSGGWI